ncbi:EAL domain-containing protein [Sphingomonas sp. 8AM]|uniref:EAL domain-containing protein n=1 Tax=Sphingomonas sp. 8AM TaxID=2653170 RepID=UPI001F2EC3B6|nr:EAL domain-containing protein [Sphingomonas sp. 8AM]
MPRLMQALVARIVAALPDAVVATVSRDVIEVAFTATTEDALALVIAICRTACVTPVQIDNFSCVPKLVAAGAIGSVHGDSTLLIERAEAALEEAELAAAVPAAIMPGAVDEGLVAEVEHALDRGEMVLHYQPKVHIRRQAIDCVEALVRWAHPERGLVLPGEFLPAAERAQRMERLTLWTITQAISDQRALRALGQDVRIFINMSGHLLADAEFVRLACAAITAAPDARLGFEVTETSVIRDPAGAIAHLREFDRIGVRISIDDYGAGLSSLAYLKQLPACELKIDKLFITQLTSSNRDPLIVRSTIDLAHALDMEVVAEGVETQAALALLSVMGCDMAQGYFISPPLALAPLAVFLAAEQHRQATQDVRGSFTRRAAGWKRG